MIFFEIFLIGLSLSMDAFAVSITNGMCYRDLKIKGAIIIGLTFGIFQGIMPLIGYYAGALFSEKISGIDHWVALILLGLIGINMIREGFSKEEKSQVPYETKPGNLRGIAVGFTYRMLFLQGVATSIDALAVGISFAALNINIYAAVVIIMSITFLLSTAAVFVGRHFGDALKNKAQMTGGIILVLIGIKIFVEHVFIGG